MHFSHRLSYLVPMYKISKKTRGQRTNESQKYDEVCGWNSIHDMASCLVFNPFWGNFDLDLDLRSLDAHLWVDIGAKYEVCRWNSLRDMTSSLNFYPFWGKYDLYDQTKYKMDRLNGLEFIWNWNFYWLKFCPEAGRLFIKWSPGSKTHKNINFLGFSKIKIFFWEKWTKP